MKKQDTFLVVTLIALSISGEMVAAETPIEVDRATRADWRGSKLARDATEEEIAEYYKDQGDDVTEALAEEVAALESVRDQLRGEIEQLTAARDQLLADAAKAVEPKAKAAK